MCRTTALAATASALALLLAGPALAKDDKPAAAPAPAATPAPPKPVKATPAERAEAERMDPISRANFWAQQAALDPRDVEADIALSRALRGLGRYDEADQAAAQALVVAPNNLEALLEQARVKIAAGQGFFAIAPATTARGLAPKDWRPVSLLAVALEQAQRDDEALAAHKAALALAPNAPGALTNYALYLASHGDLAAAESSLRQAVAQPGAGAQQRQNLVLVLGLEGRFAEAETLARQDLPPEAVANNMAWLKAAKGDTPAASTRSWDSVRRGG